MKFIHTADVHWGMEPDSDKPWSRERAQAIKDTFTQVITRARDLEVDFLFISGDLFHRQPLQRDLKEINYLFSTIPAVHVVMIAGNHDRIRSNSAVLSFSWYSHEQRPCLHYYKQTYAGNIQYPCYEDVGG